MRSPFVISESHAKLLVSSLAILGELLHLNSLSFYMSCKTKKLKGILFGSHLFVAYLCWYK